LYRDIPEEMRALIEPIVDDFGLELVDIERRQGRAPWQLRVVVDTCDGDGRVPVDTCAEVSREVGACLDAADAIPVSYRLEVSSPGLDRVLAREKDFERAVGREVRVETHAPVDGRRRFRGRLTGFDGRAARLEVDGREVVVPFAAVRRANAVYAFSKDDFAAGGRGRAGPGGSLR
jgi:ribosome maturation factor RimP